MVTVNNKQRPVREAWVQTVEVPPGTMAALLSLHCSHPVGAVLEADALGEAGLASELVGSVAFNGKGSQRPLSAMRLSDGLVFDCSGRASATSFRGELFFAVTRSGQLGEDTGRLYVTSRPADVSPGATVAGVLGGMYSAWQSVSSRRCGQQTKSLSLQLHRRGGLAGEDIALSEGDVIQLGKPLRSNVPGVSEVKGVRLAHSAAGLCLTVGREARAQFEVFDGRFGVVLEHKIDGTYVRGARALLSMLLSSPRSLPTVNLVPVLDRRLRDPDTLVQVVRSMKLQTTYAKTGDMIPLFNILGISVGEPLPECRAGVSVHALSLAVQGRDMCPKACVDALRRRGVETGTAVQAMSAAFGVFTRRHVFGDESLPRPLDLNSLRTASLPKSASRCAVPACTVEWLGEQISVSVSAGAVVFSDEKGVFALSSAPVRFVKGAVYEYTPFARGLASGAAPSVSPPPTELLAAVATDTLQAAAQRLAHLDLLTSQFPAFAGHAHTLRNIWLHSEKARLRKHAADDVAFCTLMGVLSQLKAMPVGCNFWATVPFMPPGEISLPVGRLWNN